MSDTQEPTESQLPMQPHESWLALDDKSIGYHFGAWFTKRVFDEAGLNLAEECRQKSVDQIYAEYHALFRDLPRIALDLDEHDVEGVTLEKAAEFCTKGDPVSAGVLIREFLEGRVALSEAEDEAATGRRRQSQFAQRPRRDGLSQLIWEQVQHSSGKITVAGLKAEIEASQGGEYIDEVTDDTIYFNNRDGTGGHSAPISGLSARLSRAKKKFRNNSLR